MKKYSVVALLCVPFFLLAQAPEQKKDDQDQQHPDPPMLGLHWGRDFNPSPRASAKPRSSPDMTYHGGKIMITAVTQAIFWGTSWSDGTFVADKVTGLDSWYTGFSNSNYAGT